MTQEMKIKLCYGCQIQIDPLGRRIYLMKWGKGADARVISSLDDIARQMDLTKIFVKIPSFAANDFFLNDYVQEAKISDYYGTNEHCLF